MTRVTNLLLSLFFAFTILLQLLLSYSAFAATPIIQQAEAEVGHSLSCDEAYQYRDIARAIYEQDRTQGDIVYMSHLLAPVWLGLLLLILLVAGGIARLRRQVTRLNWLLLGLVLVLLIPILIQWPVIQKIACATE